MWPLHDREARGLVNPDEIPGFGRHERVWLVV